MANTRTEQQGSDSRSGVEARLCAALESDELRTLLSHCGLNGHYLDDLRAHVVPLAAALCRDTQRRDRPLLIGLNGCQGSGKSTLAQFLALMLQHSACVRCVILSIDDFYLTRAARHALARDVHVLLQTRGVPGTHDLALLNETLDRLLNGADHGMTRVPRFDKATDDRLPVDRWPQIRCGAGLVLLEGWCVGCGPQPASTLREPVNALERNEDPQGVWRAYVNAQLAGPYQTLFDRMERLVMLAAPGFEYVREWRWQQERQLADSLSQSGDDNGAPALRMLTESSLQRFIAHYERLTRHQLETLPTAADGVIALDASHRMVAHRGSLFV